MSCREIIECNSPVEKARLYMKRVTFNLKDTSFAHAQSTVGGKVSKYVSWDRSCADNGNATFYTNEQIFECNTPREISYGVLYESKVLIPQVLKKAPEVMNRFRHIFTYDADLLNLNPSVFKFIPAGGIWIGDEFGGGSIGIKKKNRLISMVSSRKKSCPLHRFRYRLAKKLSKKGLVDVYGLEQWIHINQSLDDYMFSIVIENNSIQNYFTEKLLNCFAVGTIPVYLGCRNIADFFNSDGIIEVSKRMNPKKLVSKLTSKEYYDRMNAIRENYELCKQYEIIEDFMYENYFKQRSDVKRDD